MNQEKIVKEASIFFILIAVINLGCLIRVNFFEIIKKPYIGLSILVAIMQIAIIIIVIIILKKNVKFGLKKLLIIIAGIAIMGTFFIPVQKEEKSIGRGKSEIVPDVMPKIYHSNLYNIKLYDK